MIRTAIEVDKGLTPLRVFHQGGKDGVYSWTHAPDRATRTDCSACTRGTLPRHVRAGRPA